MLQDEGSYMEDGLYDDLEEEALKGLTIRTTAY